MESSQLSDFPSAPLFFFSSYCQFSAQFAQALENNGLSGIFKYICIDVDPETGARPPVFYNIQSALQISITEVPTIVINKGEYVLSGEEAFKWLQFQLENANAVGPQEPRELDGYNPNEMGSFSDPYASVNINSLHDAQNQSFKFLHAEDERIITPEEQVTKPPAESPPPPKVKSVQFKHSPKPDIDFTSNRFGYAGQNSKNDYSKGGSIDARLQQLLAEREATVPSPPQRD